MVVIRAAAASQQSKASRQEQKTRTETRRRFTHAACPRNLRASWPGHFTTWCIPTTIRAGSITIVWRYAEVALCSAFNTIAKWCALPLQHLKCGRQHQGDDQREQGRIIVLYPSRSLEAMLSRLDHDCVLAFHKTSPTSQRTCRILCSQVVVYSKSTCPFCRRTKALLDEMQAPLSLTEASLQVQTPARNSPLPLS